MIRGMIGKLTGKFDGQGADGAAIIEVGGVGYAVRAPALALPDLRKSAGETISLFIHTAVRDDAIDLYGFLTEEDLGFFKLLMSVSGIGPKTALGILNIADAQTLKRSIAAGDAAALTKVFGIGKKSAERMVVELRDKLVAEAGSRGAGALTGTDGEVIEALMALGYRADEARQALKTVAAGAEGTRERLSAALKQLGSRAQPV